MGFGAELRSLSEEVEVEGRRWDCWFVFVVAVAVFVVDVGAEEEEEEEEAGDIGEALLGALAVPAALATALTPRTHLSRAAAGSPRLLVGELSWLDFFFSGGFDFRFFALFVST